MNSEKRPPNDREYKNVSSAYVDPIRKRDNIIEMRFQNSYNIYARVAISVELHIHIRINEKLRDLKRSSEDQLITLLIQNQIFIGFYRKLSFTKIYETFSGNLYSYSYKLYFYLKDYKLRIQNWITYEIVISQNFIFLYIL